MSAYSDPLTKQGVVDQTKRILKSFPGLHSGFYDALTESFIRNNFTDLRVKDAIDHVIDNCPYPLPTVAQFISFDKRIKLYRHVEVCDMMDKGYKWGDFEMIKRENEKPVWRLKQ